MKQWETPRLVSLKDIDDDAMTHDDPIKDILTNLIAELRDHPDNEPLDADGRDYLAARAEARLNTITMHNYGLRDE